MVLVMASAFGFMGALLATYGSHHQSILLWVLQS